MIYGVLTETRRKFEKDMEIDFRSRSEPRQVQGQYPPAKRFRLKALSAAFRSIRYREPRLPPIAINWYGRVQPAWSGHRANGVGKTTTLAR
jgi:hypothetical protein